MKLKKIASLALAGIMAVSMLTACDTTSNNQPNVPNQPEEPTASDVVSAVEAGIKSWNSDLEITVKSSDNMDAAIEKVFDTYTDYKVDEDVIVEALNTVFGLGTVGNGGMHRLLSDFVDVSNVVPHLNNNDDSYFDGDTAWAYTVVPVTKVAFDTEAGDKIGHALENLQNVVESSTAASQGKYEYMNVDYTLYVTAGDATMANNNVNSYVIAVLMADYSARV